jgi:hypothetical protein
MAKPISDDIIKRLILSKYLLTKAREQGSHDELYSAGLAVSNVQDAIETLLRALAEHLHAQVRQQETFDQLISTVETAAAKPLTFRSALARMNKARVNFKHFALEPRLAEAQGFCRDMEQFYSDVVRDLFGIDPESVSLVGLIGHRRTENWMHQSQAALDAGKYHDAVEAAAVAFGVYRHHIFRDVDLRSLSGGARDRESISFAREVGQHLKRIYEILDLQMTGISLTDYRRFVRLSPGVMFTEGLRAIPQWRFDPPNDEDSRFCFRFVLDSILQMKRNEVPPVLDRSPIPHGNVRILKDCDVFVWPANDAEVIFRATSGTTFPGVKNSPWHQGYIPFIFERDFAWVVDGAAQVFHSPAGA